MIYVDCDRDDFSKKYGLNYEKRECKGCGKNIMCDVPIAIKGYRGFEMRKHGCPDRFSAAIFVPFGEETEKMWKELLFPDEFPTTNRGKDE